MCRLRGRIYDACMSNPDFSSDISSFPQYQQGAFLIVNKQIIPLTKKVTSMGRDFGNDIVFHEDFLSRLHAEIVHEDNKYVLYDKESTSGTFVNGRKVDQCVLNSGDLISLANILVMFVNNDSSITGKSMGTTQSLRQKGRRSEDVKS
jgi:pSer/pThr/pTyr-binding forkhead associated (FHA) protein